MKKYVKKHPLIYYNLTMAIKYEGGRLSRLADCSLCHQTLLCILLSGSISFCLGRKAFSAG